MNNLSSQLILVLAMVLVASIDASVSRRETSAWNAPSGRTFGVRRAVKSQSKPTFIVEQKEASSDDLLDFIQDGLNSPSDEPSAPRIVPASARAAAVACMSAAAIGGARHAIELISA